MSSTTRTPETVVTESTESTDVTMASRTWLGAVGAGLLAGVVMTAAMVAAMPGALETAVPALYGQSDGLVGVTAHLAHSAIFGVAFGAIVSIAALRQYGDRVTTSAALGLVYGVALWVVAASVVMPAWLGAVGFAGAPAVPTFTTTSLLTHAIYGVVLGAVYPYLKQY